MSRTSPPPDGTGAGHRGRVRNIDEIGAAAGHTRHRVARLRRAGRDGTHEQSARLSGRCGLPSGSLRPHARHPSAGGAGRLLDANATAGQGRRPSGRAISIHRDAARRCRTRRARLRAALPHTADAPARQPRTRRGHTRAAGRADLSERRVVRPAFTPAFGAGRWLQPGPGAGNGTHRCATGPRGRGPHSGRTGFRRRLRAGFSENHGRPRRHER